MKHITLGTLLLAGWLPAQEKTDAAAALARAVVIEEQEHDLAGAMREYERVAGDAAAPEAVRAEAKLHLAMAMLRVGRKDEGTALLEALAGQGGPVAERAKRALTADTAQEMELRERVTAAINLFAQDRDKGRAELRFLGPSAAPWFGQGLLAWNDMPRDLLTDWVSELIVLDKEGRVVAETLDGLRERDAYTRRAVAEGLRWHGAPLADGVMGKYLQDADAQVSAAAMKRLASALPAETLMQVLESAAPAVRAGAFASLGPCSQQRARDLIPVLEQELARTEPVDNVFRFVLNSSAFPPSDVATIETCLLALRHPQCEYRGGMHIPAPLTLPGNACVEACVQTAEVLATVSPGDPRRRDLAQVVGACGAFWGRSVLAQRLHLSELGYANGIEDWIAANGTDGDLELVLGHLQHLDYYNGPLSEWLDRHPTPAERWRAWAELAEAPGTSSGDTPNRVYAATKRATETWHPDALAWVATFAATKFYAYLSAADAFEHADALTPAARQALVTLALAPADAIDEGIRPDFVGVRTKLLAVAAAQGVDEAADAFVRASVERKWSRKSPLRLLRPESGGRPMRLSTNTVEDVLARSVALGDETAFELARELVQRNDGKLSAAGYRSLCTAALRGEPEDPQAQSARAQLVAALVHGRHLDLAAGETLFLQALAGDDAVVVQRALQGARYGELSADAAEALAAHVRATRGIDAIVTLGTSGRPEHADLLRSLLTDGDRNVRLYALRGLVKLVGTDAIDALLPLFDDPADVVRRGVCDVATTLLDRRFAPGLVRLLRDPDKDVRADAQKALEAIEYYVTQTERWQRLLHGSGLEANTAAEALLEQAKPTHDKRIRLVAIRGLGALGVKETLPLLIQMMQDPDPEIAAAATTAADTLAK